MGLCWLGIGCLPQHQILVLWSVVFLFSLQKFGILFHFLLLKNKNSFNEGIGCSSGGRVAKSVIISVPFSQIHWITKTVSWHLQDSQVCSANRWQNWELYCPENNIWMPNTCHFQGRGVCGSHPAQDILWFLGDSATATRCTPRSRIPMAARPQFQWAVQGLSHKSHAIKTIIWYLKLGNVSWYHLWPSRRNLWNCMDAPQLSCCGRQREGYTREGKRLWKKEFL